MKISTMTEKSIAKSLSPNTYPSAHAEGFFSACHLHFPKILNNIDLCKREEVTICAQIKARW